MSGQCELWPALWHIYLTCLMWTRPTTGFITFVFVLFCFSSFHCLSDHTWTAYMRVTQILACFCVVMMSLWSYICPPLWTPKYSTSRYADNSILCLVLLKPHQQISWRLRTQHLDHGVCHHQQISWHPVRHHVDHSDSACKGQCSMYKVHVYVCQQEGKWREYISVKHWWRGSTRIY